MEEKRKSRFSWYAVIGGIIFVAVCTSVILKFLSQARIANDELIAEHVVKLQQIFKQIDDSCKITALRRPHDHIDYLTVISFAGSVVGPLNLLEPKNWQGPYVEESLTMNGKEYMLLATKTGLYVVPGNGVKLSNGKIIGKTLILSPQSNIEQMMHDPQALLSNNKSLAARIETHQSVFEALSKDDFLDEVVEV